MRINTHKHTHTHLINPYISVDMPYVNGTNTLTLARLKRERMKQSMNCIFIEVQCQSHTWHTKKPTTTPTITLKMECANGASEQKKLVLWMRQPTRIILYFSNNKSNSNITCNQAILHFMRLAELPSLHCFYLAFFYLHFFISSPSSHRLFSAVIFILSACQMLLFFFWFLVALYTMAARCVWVNRCATAY